MELVGIISVVSVVSVDLRDTIRRNEVGSVHILAFCLHTGVELGIDRKEDTMEESEFGKGLVICLVKFAEHRWRWYEQKKLWKEMREKHPNLFSESDAVETHFNGASDHLYEIEVPKEWRRKKLGRKVKELRDFGLVMGHSFNREMVWTEADVERAYTMCQEIALLIDKELGLEPQIGQW